MKMGFGLPPVTKHDRNLVRAILENSYLDAETAVTDGANIHLLLPRPCGCRHEYSPIFFKRGRATYTAHCEEDDENLLHKALPSSHGYALRITKRNALHLSIAHCGRNGIAQLLISRGAQWPNWPIDTYVASHLRTDCVSLIDDAKQFDRHDVIECVPSNYCHASDPGDKPDDETDDDSRARDNDDFESPEAIQPTATAEFPSRMGDILHEANDMLQGTTVERAREMVGQFFDALTDKTQVMTEEWTDKISRAKDALNWFLDDAEHRIYYATVDWPKTAAEYLANLDQLPAPDLWEEYNINTLLAALHLMERNDLDETKNLYTAVSKPLPEWTWLVAVRFGRAYTSFSMSNTIDGAWDGELFGISIAAPGLQTQYRVLVLAAASGDLDLLRSLDAWTGNQVLSNDPEDADPYIVDEAAENGHVGVLEYLRHQHAFSEERDDSVALQAAAENGHTDAVRYLLQLKSDDGQDLISPCGVHKAFDAAAKRYQLDVLRMVLEETHENFDLLKLLPLVYAEKVETREKYPAFETAIEDATRMELLSLIADNPSHDEAEWESWERIVRLCKLDCHLDERFLKEADGMLQELQVEVHKRSLLEHGSSSADTSCA
ncbi:hypothetical protein PWT90_03444 [Aphanocladium album]|nr:hypothetical protein PWT90_03444 [Aphanocladium album]